MAAVKVGSIIIIEWDLGKKWICHVKVTEATNKLGPVEQQPTEQSAIFTELLTNLQRKWKKSKILLWLKCAYFILRYFNTYSHKYNSHLVFGVSLKTTKSVMNFKLWADNRKNSFVTQTANQVLCCHVFRWFLKKKLISSATLQYNLCLHHILHGTSVVNAFDTSKFWHFTDVTPTIYCGIVRLWRLPFILYIVSLHWTTEHCAC